jgi:uncharacterized membrane protein YagU involved in acid resistance
MKTVDPTRHPRLCSSCVRAIALGGLAVGVLDATDGVIYFGLTAGLNPIQVLQFIASGAVGSVAFQGGLATAGLGALIHFGLAFGFTAAFVWAFVRSETMRRHWGAAGLAYGAAVWLLMNLVVLPLTLVQAGPLTTLAVVHGLVGHALFVGLAAAVVSHRTLERQRAS